jgi:hypothetical protein
MRHTRNIRLTRFDTPAHEDGTGARAVYDTPDGIIVVDLPTPNAEGNAHLFASAAQLAQLLQTAVEEALARHHARLAHNAYHHSSDCLTDPLPSWVDEATTLLAPFRH